MIPDRTYDHPDTPLLPIGDAAQILGINRGTLRGKMEKYSIKKEVLVSEEE